MAVAAIFDLDGTLVTFKLDIRAWRRVLLQLMRERGYDTAGVGEATPTQEILDYAKGQVAPGGYEGLRGEAFSLLDRMELDGAESASVFPGAADVLELLRSRGVRLSVFTNSGKLAASSSLGRWDLLRFFEFVLTRDDVEAMKPRPDGLIRAAAMLGLPAAEVYYVGDSVYDIMAAKGAGMRAVAVATGNYAAERLKGQGADFVIVALSELPKVLGV